MGLDLRSEWLRCLLLSAAFCGCALPEVTTRGSSAGDTASASEPVRELPPAASDGGSGQAGAGGQSNPSPSPSVAGVSGMANDASCSGCAKGAFCIPRVGAAALCLCPPGHVGDGLLCAPDPACAAIGCGSYALCVQAAQGLACQCVKGWNGDGHNCVDLDECAAEPGPCGANERCENQFGSYTCTCQAGFERVAGGCKATGACSGEACDPHAECQAGRCVCSRGYEGNGRTCVHVPFCGDGVRESIEQCDGPDLGGLDCVDRGYSGGTLACNAGCSFNVSGCTGGKAASAGAGGS